ncbi:MAG: hypothetical protein HZB53_02560 [Chloroflexi bacterium]|nr:hypothetical protein [Chloroflexota bacterium]
MPTTVVTVDPPLVSVQAGSQATVRVAVENRSDFVGQYQLSLAGADASWVTFEPDQVAAFPGSTANATIRLSLPASVIPATYPTVVRVINQSDTSDEARALLRLNVTAAPGSQPGGTPGFVATGAGNPPPTGMPESRRTAPPPPVAAFTGVPARRAASPGAGQLELSIDRDSITVLPSGSQSINVIWRNTGGTALAIDAELQGLPPAWIRLEPAAFDLPKTSTVPGRVTISPPSEAPTGSYPITLVGTERNTPGMAANIDLVLEVGEAGGVTLEIVPPQAAGQDGATYRVRATQSGTTPLNVSFFASDPDAALAYTFNPATIYVPPSGDATSELSVRASKGLVGVETQNFQFTVTATAAEGTARAATASGLFVQQRTPTIGLVIAPAEVTAPDRATYTIRVKNPSAIQTNVRLVAADGNNACRYLINPPAVAVPAGGEAQASLLVTPQKLTAEPGSIINNFTVSAEPSGSLLTGAQASGKYVQTQTILPSIRLAPGSQSSTGAATFNVQATNTRPTALDVELRAFDAANLVELRLSTAQLRLPPNGSAQARVTARPTTKLLAGEARRPNEFTVELHVPGLEQTAQAKGTLVQVGGFNFARLIPIILLLAALVVCVGVAALTLPTIGGWLSDRQREIAKFLQAAPTPLPLVTFAPFTPTPTITPIPTPTLIPVPFAIKGVTAKVSPASANSCPTTLSFSAEIEVSQVGSITYVWEFSDGSSTTPSTLNFGAAGKQTVNTSKSFNTNGVVGGHVKITAPPSPDSNQASATLNCPAAPTAAPAAPTATPKPATATPMPTLPPAIFVANFSGDWTTNFGSMHLNQGGPSITGTYYNGFLGQGGTIAGTVTANTFNGTWSISGGTGSIQFNMGADGASFTGKFNGTTDWCGAKHTSTATLPPGCGFSGPWSIRLSGGTRTMTLVQRGDNTVSGTYNNGTANGTINGTVSYPPTNVVLNGTWTVGGSTGSIRFFLNDYNATRFQGNYNTTFEWCGWRDGGTQPAPCLRN